MDGSSSPRAYGPSAARPAATAGRRARWGGTTVPAVLVVLVDAGQPDEDGEAAGGQSHPLLHEAGQGRVGPQHFAPRRRHGVVTLVQRWRWKTAKLLMRPTGECRENNVVSLSAGCTYNEREPDERGQKVTMTAREKKSSGPVESRSTTTRLELSVSASR